MGNKVFKTRTPKGGASVISLTEPGRLEPAGSEILELVPRERTT